MPMQTSINAQLGRRVGSPFLSALLNFLVGIAALLIITSIVEHGLAIPVGSILKAPPWVLFGGAFAVVFVTGNILLMPRIGSVQTAILPALGQILMGTLIDTFGWFNSAQRDMSVLRIIGVALVIAGVLTVVLAKAGRTKGNAARKAVPHVWLWRAFGLIVGMCMASQTAVNVTVAQAVVNVTVDDALSDASANPVQNRVLKAALDSKAAAADLANKAEKVTEVTNSSTGAVSLALDAGKTYHFTGALTALTITLNAAATGQLAQYHFDFDSGSTAPTLTLPNTVTMPGGFTVEASKHYEIDILNGYGAVNSWVNT